MVVLMEKGDLRAFVADAKSLSPQNFVAVINSAFNPVWPRVNPRRDMSTHQTVTELIKHYWVYAARLQTYSCSNREMNWVDLCSVRTFTHLITSSTSHDSLFMLLFILTGDFKHHSRPEESGETAARYGRDAFLMNTVVSSVTITILYCLKLC